MEIKKELLIEKAQEGYAVCNMEGCPLRNHCLRWLTAPIGCLGYTII